MVASLVTANHIAVRNDDAEQHLCLGIYGTRVEIGRDHAPPSCRLRKFPPFPRKISDHTHASTRLLRESRRKRQRVIGVIRAC
jgi:hypothetical protein